jgi:hypothetical protein
MYYFQFLFFIIIQKKNQSRREFILLAFTLNSSIIIVYSADNGMSRCMFINAIHLTATSPSYFLNTFLNVYDYLPPLRTPLMTGTPRTCANDYDYDIILLYCCRSMRTYIRRGRCNRRLGNVHHMHYYCTRFKLYSFSFNRTRAP